ncbi:META and DUF4377 domain-containing protein [Xanthomonas maliensis]|uniref:META and DUF4377 domain-containing protein n=1 Tax=Xanthomonas maliensis TaxID=1321368 RepID=UPI0003A0D36B|nr:META and DUF4377 domain-containing protein [Xanthomonas maliensis]KAB7769805.1 hypothetical protein CKY51_06665 [Xanthomonas maliensis]
MRSAYLAPLLATGIAACTPAQDGRAPAAATAATMAPGPDTDALRGTLQARHWQLQHASDAHGSALQRLFVAGVPPLQLDFTDQRIQVSHTCNTLGAPYALAERQVQIGRVVSSKRACAEQRRMAQEQAASALLSGRFAVAMTADAEHSQLTLTRSDGTRLVFAGTPTSASQHGPGQTLLIEVAAATVPCPDAPARRCLQLREQAPASSAGEPAWQIYDGRIEGFEHEDGIRTLLRVTRYPPAPGQDAAPVYVLDQMLEASG